MAYMLRCETMKVQSSQKSVTNSTYLLLCCHQELNARALTDNSSVVQSRSELAESAIIERVSLKERTYHAAVSLPGFLLSAGHI